MCSLWKFNTFYMRYILHQLPTKSLNSGWFGVCIAVTVSLGQPRTWGNWSLSTRFGCFRVPCSVVWCWHHSGTFLPGALAFVLFYMGQGRDVTGETLVSLDVILFPCLHPSFGWCSLVHHRNCASIEMRRIFSALEFSTGWNYIN